ncbi:MAG TPA: hypothetical protein VGJ81_18155 [Thermoanaerobaculia bacterium]
MRRIGQRLNYLERLLREHGDAKFPVFHALDVLYCTSVLIEQLRKVYELIANHVDARFPGARKSLDSRINNSRPPGQHATYQYRAWLFPVLDHIPDSAFARLGFAPEHARGLLQEIVRRTAERFGQEEEELRRFAEGYGEITAAHKHGRAIFATEPSVSATTEKTVSVNMEASTSVATVLCSDSPGTPPTSFVVFRPDEAFWDDIDRMTAILDIQVPRLVDFIERFVVVVHAAIRQVEEGRNEPLPTFPFFLSGEPYTAEEERLLDAIRTKSLRLFDENT